MKNRIASLLLPLGAFAVFALLAITAVTNLSAQTITTGDLAGTVRDQSGAIVPGALVTLTSTDRGAVRTASANDIGEFRFTTLQPGNYQVSAKSPGLTSETQRLPISIGQVLTIDLILKAETAQTVVTVTDAVPLLQNDNANQTSTLTSAQIQDLPLPGGDTTTVAFTVPGIAVSTGAGYGNFSSHGLPGTSNLFTVNGNDNNDPYLNLNNSGASNLTLGANEVAEIAVVQNAYTASYGRQAGAQINTVTKSGTNDFHGNLRWDWNGAILNANDFFNNSSGTPKGRANSNQYAASFGGPVLKNKTFFFVDHEAIRYILPSSGIVSVPSQEFQNYILGAVQPNQVPFYQQAFNLYNKAPGINRAVPVTNGDGSLQDTNGALGCGSLSQVAIPGGHTLGSIFDGDGNLVSPGDTPCARAFGTNIVNLNKEWLLTARVDHQLTDKQKIFFRYKTDHGLQPTGTDPINPAFNTQSVQPAHEGQIDHTYVFTPSLVNHAIVSLSWYSALFGPVDLTQTLSTFPTALYFLEGGANGTGSLTTLGLARNMPQGRRVGQGQIIDDFSWNKASHAIRVGVNLRKNRVTDTNPGILAQGWFRFGSLDDFANGIIDGGNGDFYRQRFATASAYHLRLYNVGFYLQDEWSVKPNLKLTLGLRFDRTGNPQCVENCFSRLAGQFSDIAHNASVPYNQTILTGLGSMVADSESIVPQPRIGFAYTLGPSKKTVIRGGAGLFSDQPVGSLASSVFGNAPSIYQPSVPSGLVGTSAISGSGPAIAAASNAAFRSGFANGSTLAQIRAGFPPGGTFTPPGYFALPNTLYSPKYGEWSLELQQQFGAKNVVNISYTGNHGYNLFLENAMINTYNQNKLAAYAALPATAPDTRFRIVTNLQNNAVSNYHGLTLQYRRMFAAGFQGQVNYTWSHALDDVSNGGTGLFFNANDSLVNQIAPYSKDLSYSNADYDIRHSLTGDFTWDLPFKASGHVLNGFIGGWNMSSKMYARTGTPFSVTLSGQSAKISSSTGGSVLATVASGINASCGKSAIDAPCFSASQFSVNGFGNYPRNIFRGPGYFDIDYSVTKHFPIRENVRLAMGASFYNLLNHANFASPGSIVGAGGLGSITATVTAPTSAYGSFQGSAVSGRVIVTSARLTF